MWLKGVITFETAAPQAEKKGFSIHQEVDIQQQD